MIIRIDKITKKVLLSIDVEKYRKLMNEIYCLPNPQFSSIIEKEKVSEIIKKLIREYFPKVLEDYNIYLTLDYRFGKGSKYLLTLRKKNKKSL